MDWRDLAQDIMVELGQIGIVFAFTCLFLLCILYLLYGIPELFMCLALVFNAYCALLLLAGQGNNI